MKLQRFISGKTLGIMINPFVIWYPNHFMVVRTRDSLVFTFFVLSSSLLSWNFSFHWNLLDHEGKELAFLACLAVQVYLLPSYLSTRVWSLISLGFFLDSSFCELGLLLFENLKPLWILHVLWLVRRLMLMIYFKRGGLLRSVENWLIIFCFIG